MEKKVLEKAGTGIEGFDEITGGGLPRGRPTLVCGGPGCGKTLFGLEFLLRGIIKYDEPGVCMVFEESQEDLAKNVGSLGYDLENLIRQDKLRIDFVRIERSEIDETGEYDLEGLFVRLGSAIDGIGAKRVMLDTIEALFGGFQNEGILRAELRRLFRWLKDKGVTVVLTGERGENSFTRQGLEEYVSDCVIFLDHRVREQISTRRLRVVKYRGSSHGTNEYPFIIDEEGFSMLPITSLELQHEVSNERISTGIAKLDAMLEGKGLYRGSSILISGTAGTGKTSMASSFADASCRRGERCLYFAFEESQSQLIRNMRSIGIDLGQWSDQGIFRHVATRPSTFGLEVHLAKMYREIRRFQPRLVVVDPITNLADDDNHEARAMLMRLLDYLKVQHITGVFSSLTSAGHALEQTEASVSSLMDSWVLLQNAESSGERHRLLFLLKARGIAHSNQTHEFLLTSGGIVLKDRPERQERREFHETAAGKDR